MSHFQDQHLELLLPNSEDNPVVADSEPVIRLTRESADIPKGVVSEFPHFVEDSPGNLPVQLLQLP